MRALRPGPVLAAALTAACISTAPCEASLVGFLAEIDTSHKTFAIYNLSDPGLEITNVTIALGSGAAFSTDDLREATEHHRIHVHEDFAFTPEEDSHFKTNWDSGPPLMLLGRLADCVQAGASTASFAFTGFGAGDAWGLRVRIVEADDAHHKAKGSAMDGTVITVVFSDGTTLSSMFESGLSRSHSQSLHITATGGQAEHEHQHEFLFGARVNVPDAPPEVPAPGAWLLFALGMAGVVRFGRRTEESRPR
jgi:hypothetical protein